MMDDNLIQMVQSMAFSEKHMVPIILNLFFKVTIGHENEINNNIMP